LGVEHSDVYNLFLGASKHCPLLFEIKCHNRPTSNSNIILPRDHSLHQFTITKSGPLGILLEIDNTKMVRIKSITANSSGDIYGLQKNDIFCKPMENGKLKRDIPILSKQPLNIEVWQALPTSTRHLITSIRMPNSTSGKSENPLMFSFLLEEPTISKIQIINQVPSYNAIRLAQSLVKKGTVCTGSLSQFNWRELGLQVGVYFNSLPPNVSFLLGLLYTKYALKERKKVMRHKKETE
jgi:hypothetical protein